MTLQPSDRAEVVPGPRKVGEPVPAHLEPPALRRSVVTRERLLRRLAGTGGARLLVVTAPAGFGKTTLMTQWAAVDARPLAWLQVEADDDDPVRLVRNVGYALDRVDPVDPALFTALMGDAEALVDAALPRLGRTLRERARPLVLVLDDAHHIRARRSLEVLRTIVDHLPERGVLVVAGRSRPALPLALLRASGTLDELGPADLAMTRAESLEMLLAAVPELPRPRAEAITDRCEGWPAALYLAALVARDAPDVGLTGADRTIAGYLDREVLTRISASDRRFLLDGSVLARLSGEVCDAVLDADDSARRLERLAEAEVLVQPLDRRGEEYRVHGLFREMLRTVLDREAPSRAAELHRRAAAWYGARSPDLAVGHALAAGDTDAAAALIWEVSPEYLGTGRSGELAQLIARVEAPALAAHPELEAVVAWTRINDGDGEGALARVEALEALEEHRAPDGTTLSGLVLGLRATINRDGVRAMGEDSARALELLPEGSAFRTVPYLTLAAATHLAGDRDAAREQLAASERFAATRNAPVQTLSIAQLGLLDAERGDWGAAGRAARRAHALQRVHGFEEYTAQMGVFALSALVAAKTGDAAMARSEARRARRMLARVRGIYPWLAGQTSVVLAWTALVLGDPVSARTLLAEAEGWAKRVPDATLLRSHLDEAWERAQAIDLPLPAGGSALTSAELRALQRLASHLSLREIAEQLGVSPNTVKTQVQAVYRKLDVSSRSEAVDAARSIGLLEP